MSAQDYIASGILEVYVLGGLDLFECQEVERMASVYPEVKQEIASLQKSMEGYVDSIAIAPRKEIKAKFLKTISSEKSEEFIPLGKPFISFYRYATAASVALMLAFGGMSIYFWSKWQNAEERITSLEEQTNRFAENINKANYELNALAQNFETIRDTAVVKVNLKGVATSPGVLATVYWNKNTSEVMIDPGNLPKAPEGMQYQLWALDGGIPVDAGVFEINVGIGIQKVKTIQAAQAYAVTLEKLGGSESPTLSAMWVFGEVKLI